MVGNSDLHDLRQLGRTYSLVVAEPSADAVCARSGPGACHLETTPVPKLELAQVLGGMFRRDEGTAPAASSTTPEPSRRPRLRIRS